MHEAIDPGVKWLSPKDKVSLIDGHSRHTPNTGAQC